jgi:hypothetical protein
MSTKIEGLESTLLLARTQPSFKNSAWYDCHCRLRLTFRMSCLRQTSRPQWYEQTVYDLFAVHRDLDLYIGNRSLATLNIQPSVDLDSHPSHTCVLGQHDERIRTILQIGLVFQHSLVFGPLDYVIGIS